MRSQLSNCLRCGRLFRQEPSQELCATCFGQKVFGRAPAPELAAAQRLREFSSDTERTRRLPEHALRCELRARQALAHAPGMRRGQVSHWAPNA